MLDKASSIFTSFEPNMETDDVRLGLGLLFAPTRWPSSIRGTSEEQVRTWLRQYFGTPHAWTVDSGRSALYIILKASGVGQGDEVILQAYTCVVVVNAITALGARPIYVDIDATANLDPKSLEQRITPRTKAVIIQHTFGQPANVQAIKDITDARQLTLIEDCAHALGGTYDGKKLGTIGDAAMFSFGSDKVVSCVRGGAIIAKNELLAARIEHDLQTLGTMSFLGITQHLIRYPLFYIGKKWYRYGVGKWLLAFTKAIHLINRIITQEEKRGVFPKTFPKTLPNAFATLLFHQLSKLSRFNMQRATIADYYRKNLAHPSLQHLPLVANASHTSVALRYTILVPDPGALHAYAKKRGIILGDWYDTVIAPDDIDAKTTHYKAGSCPRAEAMAKHSLNLPTHPGITLADAAHVVAVVQDFFGQTGSYADTRNHG